MRNRGVGAIRAVTSKNQHHGYSYGLDRRENQGRLHAGRGRASPSTGRTGSRSTGIRMSSFPPPSRRSAKASPRFPWWVFTVGAAASMLNVLAPIHELGHVLATFLVGGRVRAITWSWVGTQWINPDYAFLVAYAGYTVEVLLLVVAIAAWGRKPFGVFCFGAVHIAAVSAPFSPDFNAALMRAGVSDGARLAGKIGWVFAMLVLLSLLWDWMARIWEFSGPVKLRTRSAI